MSGQSRLHDWLGFELLSAFAIETTSFRGVCRRSCRLSSLPLKPSPSSELFVAIIYSVPRRHTLDTQFDCAAVISDRLALLETSSLQGKHISKIEFLKSRKGVVKLKVHFGVPPEKATPIPHSPSVSVDWMSVREVAELYGSEKSLPVVEAHRPLSGLHSIALSDLERSERFYAKLQRRRQELTQATPDQPMDDEAVYYNVADAGDGATLEFDSVVEQLRQVVVFMQRQFGMTMDGAGLS
ncbi:hypothetical protein Scep_026032 [Stephania cephalantha]|uniref:Uncharacterized protein n=1 Tax=Stephania cephalantha TaxID=152367 RepID=A0AAP0EPZ1_9MAGN